MKSTPVFLALLLSSSLLHAEVKLSKVFTPHMVFQIEGDKVVVSSASISQPATVRYAWSNAFQWANLFLDGFPAQPFRTNAW